MKLKYLLIVNNHIDELVYIFERDTPTARLLEYVDYFLIENELLDEFNACERDEDDSLFEHYKNFLSDRETHIAMIETELAK